MLHASVPRSYIRACAIELIGYFTSVSDDPVLYATLMGRSQPGSCAYRSSASTQPRFNLVPLLPPHSFLQPAWLTPRTTLIITMAEIFGAVASGAGLVSLSMQLLESTQKLKGFYDSCRDAPDTVRQLCFDLETMALALRQFEQYRQNDLSGSELLGHCIVACNQAVAKIKTAVDKIDWLLCKTRFAGRLYMGFKEPEVRRLLEDVERAKSSMALAYMSYCQYAQPDALLCDEC